MFTLRRNRKVIGRFRNKARIDIVRHAECSRRCRRAIQILRFSRNKVSADRASIRLCRSRIRNACAEFPRRSIIRHSTIRNIQRIRASRSCADKSKGPSTAHDNSCHLLGIERFHRIGFRICRGTCIGRKQCVGVKIDSSRFRRTNRQASIFIFIDKSYSHRRAVRIIEHKVKLGITHIDRCRIDNRHNGFRIRRYIQIRSVKSHIFGAGSDIPHIEGSATRNSRRIRGVFCFGMVTERLVRAIDLYTGIIEMTRVIGCNPTRSPYIIAIRSFCTFIAIHPFRIEVIAIIQPIIFIAVSVIIFINRVGRLRSGIPSAIRTGIFIVEVERSTVLLLEPGRKPHPRNHARILRHNTTQVICLKGTTCCRVCFPAGIRISRALPTDVIDFERFIAKLKA